MFQIRKKFTKRETCERRALSHRAARNQQKLPEMNSKFLELAASTQIANLMAGVVLLTVESDSSTPLSPFNSTTIIIAVDSQVTLESQCAR